jgi:hypothetical protein
MKKKLQLSILILSAIVLFSCSGNKKGYYEEDAIKALDNLSEVIGELKSCSFTLNTSTLRSKNENTEPIFKTYDIYMRGSDKMYYYTESKTTKIGHWYDGEELAVFNFDNNNYDVMDAPATLMETINLFHEDFKITFPAADFFYPTLTDDIIQSCDTVVVSGTKVIDEVECTEINASNENMDIYILIEKATNLPKALAIYYLGDKKGQHYISVFSNWRQNPNLPDNIFKFAPPENAIKASILTSKLAK